MNKLSTWFSSQISGLKSTFSESNTLIKAVIFSVFILLCITCVLGFVWSSDPSAFDVTDKARARADIASPKLVTGVTTTATLINVMDTLMSKSGGYLSNDVTPPGLWLDNIPSWEYGVLIQVRDLTKAMREAYSRSQSQSTEDKDLALAESRFNFDHRSWLLPASENEFAEGIDYLQKYLDRLSDEDQANAQFYARSDNLRYWLSTVETRLGSLSQRLSASVGQRRINLDLAGDASATQSTASSSELQVKTPWREIDNVFYEARGSAWALIHFLKAVEVDFAEVLDNKNARVSLQQIIRELEGSQQSMRSPLILNGTGFGMLPNHSLVMASYISRANAAIIDLRELLARG